MKVEKVKCAECEESRTICPKCEARLAAKEYVGCNFNIKGAPYSQPIHSDAMAIQPSQVAEHRELFPDVKIDEQCRPVMENSDQHQKYMDACGFVKKRQSTRMGGEIIAVLEDEDAESETQAEDTGAVHEN